MKKSDFIRRILCAILVLVCTVTPVSATEADIDMSISQGCRTLDGMVPLLDSAEELDEAYAALLYDINTDTIVFGKNLDEPQNPAGLVKIMTGLIVAERGNMEDTVTIRQEVLDTISSGSRSLDFQDGEVIPMVDLMYCLLIEGANEAAAIAAEHVFGSQEACVEEMNKYAAELGCTGTNFANVHGLHDSEQVTTARDVAKILSVAIQNEHFWEAYSTYVVRIPATNMAEERKISSGSFVFNKNLGSNHYDKRVTGSRTGTTVDGTRNIAVTAEVDGVQLMSIILGSVSEIQPSGNGGFYKEARVLLDKGFNEHKSTQVLHENQVMAQFEVENGDSNVSVCVNCSVQLSLPQSLSNSDLTYRYEQDNAQMQSPIQAGDNLGTVYVWYHDVCLAQADIFALHDVKVKEVVVTEQITEEKENSAITMLIIVAVMVGLLVVLLFGRPLIFRMIRRRQIRRHKEDRRRRR